MKHEWNHAIDLCIKEVSKILRTYEADAKNIQESENFESAMDDILHGLEELKEIESKPLIGHPTI